MLAEERDDESKDFVTFPDYTKRFEEVEPLSFAIFDTVNEGNCQSAIPNAQRYRRVGEETYRRKQTSGLLSRHLCSTSKKAQGGRCSPLSISMYFSNPLPMRLMKGHWILRLKKRAQSFNTARASVCGCCTSMSPLPPSSSKSR